MSSKVFYGDTVLSVFPKGNQDINTLSKYNVEEKVTVRISETERAKIIPENIANGITILGVEGTHQGGSIEGGYLVQFILEGEPYCNISVLAGDAVQEPSVPDAYVSVEWYTGQEGSGTKILFPYTPVADITLYAVAESKHLVGIQGFGTSDPSVTMFGDIADIPMYTTETDGDYVSVINPLDNYWPFNKIEEFTDSNGNVFVKFPKMWMRWLEGSTTEHWIEGVRFANYKVDDNYFISDAFLDPKDTTGNTYLDYFAIGKYLSSGSESKIYSKGNQTILGGVMLGKVRSAARAYGNSSNLYNGYQLLDIQQLTIYNILCMMYYHTKNMMSVYDIHSGTAFTVSGTTDGVSGMNGWNTAYKTIKFLGIENPFGRYSVWADGILFNNTTIYLCRFPQNYSDSTSNYLTMGFSRPTAGVVRRLRAGTSAGTKSVLYPSDSYTKTDWQENQNEYFGSFTSGYFNSSYVNGFYVGNFSELQGLFNYIGWDWVGNPSMSATGSSRLAYRPV